MINCLTPCYGRESPFLALRPRIIARSTIGTTSQSNHTSRAKVPAGRSSILSTTTAALRDEPAVGGVGKRDTRIPSSGSVVHNGVSTMMLPMVSDRSAPKSRKSTLYRLGGAIRLTPTRTKVRANTALAFNMVCDSDGRILTAPATLVGHRASLHNSLEPNGSYPDLSRRPILYLAGHHVGSHLQHRVEVVVVIAQ